MIKLFMGKVAHVMSYLVWLAYPLLFIVILGGSCVAVIIHGCKALVETAQCLHKSQKDFQEQILSWYTKSS